MSKEPSALLDLALKTFTDLNFAELEVLMSAELGRLAVLSDVIRDDGDGKDQTNHIAKGIDHYLIRAEFLQWLCTNKEAVAHISSRGVNLRGGKIEKELDLSYTTVPFSLDIKECAIPHGIKLEYSTFGNLS